jgi:tRNA U34 2-thiouridine synthase MnmA/TrmU
MYDLEKLLINIFQAPGTHHPSLYSDLFFTLEPHWINKDVDRLLDMGVMQCQFKFQNTHRVIDCTVGKSTTNTLVVRVSTNIRALTPGQVIHFQSNPTPNSHAIKIPSKRKCIMLIFILTF